MFASLHRRAPISLGLVRTAVSVCVQEASSSHDRNNTAQPGASSPSSGTSTFVTTTVVPTDTNGEILAKSLRLSMLSRIAEMQHNAEKPKVAHKRVKQQNDAQAQEKPAPALDSWCTRSFDGQHLLWTKWQQKHTLSCYHEPLNPIASRLRHRTLSLSTRRAL